jgi:hypothetical protein
MSFELELSPAVRACLAELSQRDLIFDEDEDSSSAELRFCRQLENIGYASATEVTEPQNVIVYSITEAGKKALKFR